MAVLHGSVLITLQLAAWLDCFYSVLVNLFGRLWPNEKHVDVLLCTAG